MHRHGYQGRKFNRQKDQRRALMKALAESLIKYESIETTFHKGKEVIPYVEKMITKAKRNTLHDRRLIIRNLQTIESAHKLIDEITPKLSARKSGYLRLKRTTLRKGDNAQMGRVEFVDSLAAKVKTDDVKPEKKIVKKAEVSK
ncbi:MAG TPA: 50S ribosomal protein L17 [Candidatus Dormibacteraeota bacterium]|nr:50S ribosomal protein L17 [Candidatus Dormibacteraeota bacterium]